MQLTNPFTPVEGALTPSLVAVQTKFVGMMQYDGDLKLPARFLVPPPAISGVSGELLAQEGVTTFACSETQKFGHVSIRQIWGLPCCLMKGDTLIATQTIPRPSCGLPAQP